MSDKEYESDESEFENSSDEEELNTPRKRTNPSVVNHITYDDEESESDESSYHSGGEEDDDEQIGGVKDDDDEEDPESKEIENEEEVSIADDDNEEGEEGEVEEGEGEEGEGEEPSLKSDKSKKTQIKKATQIQLELDDDEDDDDDDEYENYLQKFDGEITKNYVQEFHPECLTHNYDEIAIMTKVIRNADGIIIDPLHRTVPFLTKYERARIIGQRAKQIETGAKPFISVPENVVDSNIIAELELKAKKIPFIIRRPIPGGGSEYWNIQDLENIIF